MKAIIYYPLLMAICAVVVRGSAVAQNFPTDKGSQIVSGGFTYSSLGGDLYEWNGDRLTVIRLSPSLSYFVIPGLALGGRFLLEKTLQGSNSFMIWGIGPHITYFVGGHRPTAKVKGTTYPYLGAAFFYREWGSTTSGTMISFTGGILHMVSNAVGLFGEASYDIESMKSGSGDSVSGNTLNIATGFTVFLY